MPNSKFVGARAKTKAAAGHFNRLEPILRAYTKNNQNAIIADEVGGFIEISCDLPALPPEASIVAGEVVYQLRSALDVMTCEMARWSGATDTSKTYFPMARDQVFFDAPSTQRKIAALSPDRQGLIQSLRPYDDADLLALNALANFDRHDDLLKAIPSVKDTQWTLGGKDDGQPFRAEAWFRQPAPDEIGKITFMRMPKVRPVEWGHFKLSLEFVFTLEGVNGEPVLPKLSMIGKRVAAIINEFERAENP